MKKSKILIDGLMLLSPFTGIAKYTYENSKRMQLDNSDIYYYYGYFSSKLIEPTSSNTQKIPFIKKLKAMIVKNELIKKFVRTIILKYLTHFYKKEFDIFWEPNHLSNAKIKAKYRVTTVHDLSFHLHPDWHPKERVEYFEKYFWDEIVKSDRIITGSHYSKQELLEYIDFDADKVDVIYHGVDLNNFKSYSKEILQNSKKQFCLPEKFILSVGSIEPRKNLLSLLSAYKNLSKKQKEEYKLVLVGFKGWRNDDVMTILNEEENNIIYLGYLSDLELAYVYNLASLFCYPSFYEGFGLPPLEAMACGTPVITSNITSIPEVCEDAAIYVDPYSVQDIKEKMALLLQDTALQKKMIEKGLQRVKQFTWDKSAHRHLEVFNEILALQ
jgi:glycosyltransferase involved in cell wall biosynthesis